jgi:hypothetical protein
MDNKKKNYLTEDDPFPGQKWVCVSIITPETVKSDQKFDVRSFKVRGSFATYEEAVQRASELQEIDKHFNIYVGEVGKWLPLVDDPDKAKEENYGEEQLNKLMKAHYENRVKSKELFEQRKQELIEKNLGEQTKLKKKNKKRRKKEGKESNKVTSDISKITLNEQDDIIKSKEKEFEQKEKEIEEVTESVKDTQKEITVTTVEMEKHTKKSDDIAKKLAEKKALYEKLTGGKIE